MANVIDTLMTAETYDCAACAGRFLRHRSDEELDAEFAAAFPGCEHEETALVCDRCYERFTTQQPQEA